MSRVWYRYEHFKLGQASRPGLDNGMKSLGSAPMISGWEEWHAYGQRLDTDEGVHRPSEFSALLSSTLADTGGLTVLDAGCGAGLISLAALTAGARHVVAMDRDPAALESTAANVRSLLGDDARSRLSLWQADFSQLDALAADVLAVNPPQRPDSILGAVETTERHLHTGAGADGLDTLRLVLANAAATEIRTTAAPALRLAEADLEGPWGAPTRIAAETLPVHPAWGEPDDRAEVGVWSFRRSS
jgi:16S rRNA G966 N2-methylase RsmD